MGEERRAAALSSSEWVDFTKEKFEEDLKKRISQRRSKECGAFLFNSVTRPDNKMMMVMIRVMMLVESEIITDSYIATVTCKASDSLK